MSDYIESETQDTDEIYQDDGGGNNDTAEESDEQLNSEEETEGAGAEPEKPRKLWAGRFEQPEEMEKNYFRSNQENNQLKKEIETLRQQATPQQTQPQISDEQRLINEKYADAYQRNMTLHGRTYDEETIQLLAFNEAEREARHELKIKNLEQSVNQRFDWQEDPFRPTFDKLLNDVDDPDFHKYAKTEDGKKVLRALAIHQSRKAQQTAPTQNKGAAGSGGSGRTTATRGAQVPADVEKNLQHFNIKSKEARQAFLKASGGM